jgi:hypothetical protein
MIHQPMTIMNTLMAEVFLNVVSHFLGKACGAAKLLFYHYVRFFLQNLPKLCILWVGLSDSERAGKRL